MNPIFWRYGSFVIRYSHLIFLGAVLLSYNLSFRKAKSWGIAPEQWEKSLSFFIVGGVLMSRLSYVLTHISYFEGNLRGVVTLWHGAFTVWGATIGFALTAISCRYLCRNQDKEVWKQGLDVISVVFPLFLSIAVWGLWTEGEGWGKAASILGTWLNSADFRYPLWLIYSVWYLVTSLVLTIRTPRKNGENFYLMALSFAVIHLALTPVTIFIDNSELIVQLIWTILFLIGGGVLFSYAQTHRPHQ
ncbi:hypothetical protein JCM15765_41560 [Paradesulfitobacterium aromaticivorans]